MTALAQNRIGKDNAAVEFSKTDIIQRTWPRLRSIATLWILALTIPISVWGGLLLVLAHLLKGGRLVGWSPNPSNKTRKGYHPTAIVTGAPLQHIFNVQYEYCLCTSIVVSSACHLKHYLHAESAMSQSAATVCYAPVHIMTYCTLVITCHCFL